MSLITKLLSISVLPLFLCLIPLLQIKALALDPTTSLSLIIPINVARHETDFHALLAFKSNIFPEYQQALSSWNESLHFCHWEGVKCGHRHGRVIVIDLTSRGLMGSLSPYIGNLSFLHELSLKNNTFIGEIPTELGNLFRLHKLNLEQNGFKGTIPTSLFHCSNLTYLSVSRNKLVGEFPKKLAYFMPRLVTLYIDNNNFTGGHGIPPSIGNLTSLEHFDASNNPFGGSIPNALGQLKNLRELWLGNTTISGTIPPALYNLSLLVRLSVPHNRLWGSLPPSFGFMFSHLEALQLFTNKFNGPIPLSISNCSQLVQLELSENNFSGSLRNDFGALRNLRFIILSDNNFKTRGSNGLSFLSSFINCSNLEWMGLENNQFGGVLPNLVGNLSLDQLGLSGNQIYGSIPSTIGNLVNLEVLDLNDNLFTGSIPESVGYLHKLQYLGFSNNKISGEIPKSIGNLSMMNELYLEKNRLEGAIPGSLGNCQKLLILTLSDNNLNGSIPRQLLMVSSLSIALHLARNHLSGSLPPEVGKLKNLAEIDISENGLSGEIPNTLGSCSSLENLFLQRNFFQGSIPPSMEFMRGIQNLDLSHNNLSGQIPRFLGTFDLKNLNLSFNNFEGELPMKGVFTNASTISIAGNHRLCGGISELQLPRCKTKKSRNKMSRSQMLGIMAASVLVGVTAVSSFLICWFKKKRNTKPAVSLLKDSFLKVSYGELLKATEGFSSTNLLGFGSFGRVYKGVIEQNGELVVAVKVLDLQTCGATKSFVAECEALRNIRHRNLVSIITSCSSMDFQGNEFKALVYEFMPNGSLDKWLHAIPEENNGEHELVGLNLLQRVDIAMDIACALDYLHHQCEMPIIHRDLKPSNILLDDDMVAHVGDFGLARFRAELNIPSTSSSTAIRGTIGYAAPEYGMGSEMSTSGDVYSYGILLLEMITRKRPTDKMFEANLNLHNFARIALPHRVMEIVDPMLLTEETYGSKIMENMISLIKIGLTCSTESPKNRMNINTALHELQLIKNNILKANIDSWTLLIIQCIRGSICTVRTRSAFGLIRLVTELF